MTSMTTTFNKALALLCLLGLAGCSGGSGRLPIPPPPPTFTIGGMANGVAGSGLVLQNNGGDDLAVTTSGTFSFATPLASAAAYSVTVKTQPTIPWQTCVVSNAAGTVGSANIINIVVTCTTNTYTVGGSVTGLKGS